MGAHGVVLAQVSEPLWSATMFTFNLAPPSPAYHSMNKRSEGPVRICTSLDSQCPIQWGVSEKMDVQQLCHVSVRQTQVNGTKTT